MHRYTKLLVSSFFLLLGVVLATSVLAPSISTAQDDREEAHKEAVRRVVEEGYNQGNVDVVDELIAPDYISYSPGGGEPEDLADFKDSIQAFRAALPDLQATADPIIAEGDWVAFRFTLTGTFENDLTFAGQDPIPPTGQPFTFSSNILGRFNEEGLMVEEWDEFDSLTLLFQLGLSPSDLFAEPTEGG